MPSCPPRYSKHVLLLDFYNNQDLAIWMYQRLLYSKIPVWLSSIDLGPGCGYGSSIGMAIDCANPILLFSPTKADASTSIEKLKQQNDKLQSYSYEFFVITEDTNTQNSDMNITIFDFSGNREIELSRLINKLRNIDYPEIISLDGGNYVKAANEYQDENYKIHYFLEAMLDINNESVRTQAITELGKLHVQSGMITAALKDPAPLVRSSAALALARIGSKNFRSLLNTVAIEDKSLLCRLSATIALSSYAGVEPLKEILSSTLNSHNPKIVEAAKKLIPFTNGLIEETTLKQHISHKKLKHVFISYARKDAEDFALNLAKQLRDTGFPIWIDENLEPGSPSWQSEIDQAIEEAYFCLFIISPRVRNSEWIQRERKLASDYGKDVIPIIYKETKPTPLFLNIEQGLRPNKSFEEHFDEMFQILVEALSIKLAKYS